MPAYLLIGPGDVDPAWLEGVQSIGVPSGASTPESSVQAVVERLRELGAESVTEVSGVDETIEFKLPAEVR